MNKVVLATLIAVSLPAVPALAQQQNGQPGQVSPSNQPQTNRQPSQNQLPPGHPTLSQNEQTPSANANRSEIRRAQQALAQKGFNAGRPDGMIGPRTRQALENFQKKQKLQANGQLDQQTLAALGVSGSTVGQSPGSSGGSSKSPKNQQ